MAEATMNMGGMPPQLPPSGNSNPGDGAAGAMPMATANTGLPVPMNNPSTPLTGVAGGVMAFRGKVEEVLQQPSIRRSLPAIILLFVLLIAFVAYQGSQTVPYRAVMPGMTENDKQAAMEALKVGDFKPKLDSSTGQIMVAEPRYYEARIYLAAQGIPKEAQPIGMDSLKDRSSMTTSQFMEQVNYNSAMEQELARSIMQISTIKTARVHLALPKQSVFVRDRATPKASVVVTPHTGRGVSTPQVKAIVNLISSSVPYLTPQNVSVVDDQGNLMTDENPVDAAMGLTVAQMQHKMRTEESYRNRVTELLAPVVGENNIQSQVNLTLDFDTVETTTEDFDNKDKGVKPRSEAMTTERKFKLDPEGIPGALSNTPPPDANLTVNTDTNEKKPLNNEITTTKSTRNFEMDRAVRHEKKSLGTISRLSVAVVVAERPAPPPADGKPLAPNAPKTIPYTAEELDRMLNLVRSSVGYNAERGDVVTVAPARFESQINYKPEQWYENSDIQNFIKIAIAALVIIVFLIAVVRPMVKGPTIQQIMPPALPPVDENKLAAEAAAAAAAAAAAEAAAAEEAAKEAEAAAAEEAAEGEGEEGEGEEGEEGEEGDEDGEEEEEVEIQEGETLEELKARMQSMKPKKPTFSADMLDTANSYDDKVALIRMLVSQESGRVAMVLKNMVKN
ncbi:MAG: Flagellar M-ring protein [Pseudomonadota bacterium]